MQKFNVKLIVPVLPVLPVLPVRTGTIVPVRSYWYFHFYVTEYIVEKYFLYRYDRTGTYRYDRTGSSRFNLATGRRVIFAHPVEIQNMCVRAIMIRRYHHYENEIPKIALKLTRFTAILRALKSP